MALSHCTQHLINELKRKNRFGFGVFDPDVFLPQVIAKETADSMVLEAELKTEIENHLSNLSPKYREVIVLHYFEELSYQEISDILQIPMTTVGVRIMRARNKLKQHIQKHMNNLTQNILKKIKEGEVTMQPRWHFVLRTALMICGVVLASLIAVYLFSFVLLHCIRVGCGLHLNLDIED